MEKILGLSMPFKVNNRQVEVHPVLLRDWTKFARVVGVFDLESLQDIFFYNDAPEFLFEAIKLVCKSEEVPELFYDMTQADYERFRNLVMEQNGLDFKAIRESAKKKEPQTSDPLTDLV